MGEVQTNATSNLMDSILFGLNHHSINFSNHTSGGTQLDHEGIEVLKTNLNAMFLVVMGAMIIFMQAGFGFLEAGSIRSKNTTNILIKNFADLSFGGLGFWLVGYGIAFGEGDNGFIGTTYFASIGVPPTQYPHMFFQLTFAATCTTIVSGSIAERANFNSYIVFCTVVTAVVYPIGAHWGWGYGGWLKLRGFSDFAGSGVVHVVGGVHALIGAIILGPRVDRFRDDESKYIAGHSIPLISLGGFILTFGFMAFNAGSQMSVTEAGDDVVLGSCVTSTLVAAGGGGVTVLLIWKVLPDGGGVWSLAKTINGMLAGMVSVCAGCDAYYPWTALFLGCTAGFLHLLGSLLLVRLKIDDPLDAAPIHFLCGFFGLIMAPIVRNDGVLTTGSDEALHTLLWNVIGGFVLAGYSVVTASLLFWTLDRMGVLRVNVNAEVRGLDILKHNEPAYGYGLDMLQAPQVAITEQQWQDILIASEGKPLGRNWKTLKGALMPSVAFRENAARDERRFIPSPISTSTDAFIFNTGVIPAPVKSKTPKTELPTNGDAWQHNPNLSQF